MLRLMAHSGIDPQIQFHLVCTPGVVSIAFQITLFYEIVGIIDTAISTVLQALRTGGVVSAFPRHFVVFEIDIEYPHLIARRGLPKAVDCARSDFIEKLSLHRGYSQ